MGHSEHLIALLLAPFDVAPFDDNARVVNAREEPAHFDGAQANGSLFAQLIDLISFTSYDAD